MDALDCFDFSALESDDFKEDAVREEIIYPILNSLGYKATGVQKVVRSKSLTHPFVHIGSTKKKISIIPDYTLFYEEKPVLILDAKSPKEQIIDSGNVEQAFSYAIHPDIRCDHYALCNGRQLSFFHVSETTPIAVIDIEENKNNIGEFEKYLSPEYLLMPEKRDFMKDFGVFSKKLGVSENTNMIFVGYYLQSLIKVESNLYTASAVSLSKDEEYMVSFDFDESIFQKLKSLLPEEVSISIDHYISRQPFQCDLNCKVILDCSGTLGKLQTSEITGEEFIPVVINDVSSAVFNPDEECGEME